MRIRISINIVAGLIIIISAFYSTPLLADSLVVSEKEIILQNGNKASILILCIDGFKYVQAIVYDYNGKAISASIAQMKEKSTTGEKPVSCYKSDTSN